MWLIGIKGKSPGELWRVPTDYKIWASSRNLFQLFVWPSLKVPEVLMASSPDVNVIKERENGFLMTTRAVCYELFSFWHFGCSYTSVTLALRLSVRSLSVAVLVGHCLVLCAGLSASIVRMAACLPECGSSVSWVCVWNVACVEPALYGSAPDSVGLQFRWIMASLCIVRGVWHTNQLSIPMVSSNGSLYEGLSYCWYGQSIHHAHSPAYGPASTSRRLSDRHVNRISSTIWRIWRMRIVRMENNRTSGKCFFWLSFVNFTIKNVFSSSCLPALRMDRLIQSESECLLISDSEFRNQSDPVGSTAMSRTWPSSCSSCFRRSTEWISRSLQTLHALILLPVLHSFFIHAQLQLSDRRKSLTESRWKSKRVKWSRRESAQ